VQLDVIADRHDALELLVAAHTTNDALRAAMKKLQDLPRLLARLRMSQARPQLLAFKQLHDSINQLLGLRDIVAALAPAAAAAAAAAGGSAGAAAATAQPKRQPPQRQPGSDWLFGSMNEDNAFDDDRAGFIGGAGLAAATAFFAGSEGPAEGGLLYSAAAPPRTAWGRHEHHAAVGSASGQQPAAGHEGPWDRLRITRKLLQCIGTHLSPCEGLLCACGSVSCCATPS
jgi:hypothetical protein